MWTKMAVSMRRFPIFLQTATTQPLIRWLWSYVFIAAYVFLDWASYIDPFHRLNISPWNPAPALGILFLMGKGAGGIFTLVGSMLFADVVVRSPTAGLASVIFLNLALASGYKLIAEAMVRIFRDQGMFCTRDALLTWVAIVVTSTYVNSLLFVSLHAAIGLLPPDGWGAAVFQLWLGDGVGILVTLPLLWHLRNRRTRTDFFSVTLTLETLGYVSLGGMALWMIFIFDTGSGFRYFYVLFLPVVWAATRQGIAGAIVSIALMQVGMIFAGQMQDTQEISLIEIQMRVLVLALVGFFIGVVVDEQSRSARQLRETMRLAMAGEMAGAIAHELNQPLTALSAYSSACRLLVDQNNTAKLPEVVSQMIVEANRAANVVRRLRDLFGSGATALSRFMLSDLLYSAMDTFRKHEPTEGIALRLAGHIPDQVLYADRIQLEILLRNLLANAKDALVDSGTNPGNIELRATRDSQGCLRICVEDNGPGINGDFSGQIFDPFVSSKSSGLGLGLTICREIATAHGGSLTYITGNHGCFELVLPTEH